MKIVDIFAIIKESLYSVQFEQNDCDEFALAFRNWADTEYLEDFFETNKADLQSGFYGNITVEEAIFKTIDEATDFEAVPAVPVGVPHASEHEGQRYPRSVPYDR